MEVLIDSLISRGISLDTIILALFMWKSISYQAKVNQAVLERLIILETKEEMSNGQEPGHHKLRVN
ncbi:hypothetical protein P7F88_19315 [Vibrio hannami]|uniref:hypothetical protein n=1 Tax=Vibrio hannami TaxID=2717094 RepID=UPI00240FFD38|nr:hypothetical protein [Vibrio hannami]MDG3088106.1 hypothetical protein [Vibrio hannami]